MSGILVRLLLRGLSGRASRRWTLWMVLLISTTPPGLAQRLPQPDLSSAEPRVREAIEQARRAVERSPDDAKAWGQYAMTLEAHRWLEDAATGYRRAHQLDPSVFEWSYFLAVLLEYQDPVEAREWHQRAAVIDPGYVPARIHYAETLEKLGETSLAREQFERAVEVDSNEPLAHFGLGRLALAEGRLEQAVPALERAFRLAPGTQAIVATLARAYQRAGRGDEARRLAGEARSLPRMTHRQDPRRAKVNDLAVNLESYLQRSKVYREVGQLDRALAELETAIEIDPEFAEAHFSAASVYDRMTRPREAVDSARKALELDPDLLGARPVLAGALAKLGRLAEAEQQVQVVLQQEPGNFHMLVVGSLLAAQRGEVEVLLERVDRAWEVRSQDRGLRRVLRQLLLDLSDSLAAIGQQGDAAFRLRQVVQLLTEEGAPESEIEAYRRRLQALDER